MFKEIIKFELAYQWRAPLFLIISGVFALLAFLATASENVSVGGGTGNLNLNANFAIIQTQYAFGLILMFAAAAFAAIPITRDYDSKTAEMMFSTGVGEKSYFFGRFFGGWFFTFLVGISAMLGTMLGTAMPWLDQERIAEFTFAPYWYSVWAVILPASFITCGLFFSVAAKTRSVFYSYVAAAALLVAFIVAGVFTDQETIGVTAILDPFGLIAFGEITRYWTVADKNYLIPDLQGSLLYSRLLWVGLTAVMLLFFASIFKFQIEPKRRKLKKQQNIVETPSVATSAKVFTPSFTKGTAFRQYLAQVGMEVRSVFRSYPFYVILVLGVLNVLGGFFGSISQTFGTPNLPVTEIFVRVIAGGFLLFVFMIMVFYAGELIHHERQRKVAELIDSSSFPNAVMVLAKLTALWMVIIAMLVVAVITAIVVQISSGFYDINLPVYLVGVFVVLGWQVYLLAALAIFIQVMSPNKFIGMLGFVVVFVLLQTMDSWGLDHFLYQFGTPGAPYSAMNGYGHFIKPLVTVGMYWTAFAVLLLTVAHLFHIRGTYDKWRDRAHEARNRITGSVVGVLATALIVFVGFGGWIFYNTNVLNEYTTQDYREEQQAIYEKNYQHLLDAKHPEAIAVTVEVDIFPDERRLESKGTVALTNPHDEAISELHITLPLELTVNTLTTQGQIVESDKAFGYYRIALDQPLAPGGNIDLSWNFSWLNPGFVNSGSTTRLVGNGTFVNNTEIMPVIGYNSGRELQDNSKRRKYDLPPVVRLPELGDKEWLHTSQMGVALRTAFKATVSTKVGQTAIAPGYLKKDWVEGDRHYFAYEMDEPIWPFFSFQSAEYEVVKDNWEGKVDLEIYYHKDHDYNIESMMRASKKSLDYFSKSFSPYQYRQFRILEFPRYAGFAQSFPNTIPFSESIGFIADLSDEKDVDYVFYITAHELAHQWWAHQLIGARMQGMTVLVETLAQYSALMVMEQEYGVPQMRRFLKYELDNYLTSRGGELIEELPLLKVENQGYIHYRKGSVVMYALRDAIGEEAVNLALRNMLERYAFKSGPFPTSKDLVEEFRLVAGSEHQQLITDLFERITLYDLKVAEASLEQSENGSYEVEFTVEVTQFEADGQGVETEVEGTGNFEIAVFPEKPDDLGDNQLPEPLYLELHQLSAGTHTFKVVVDEEPRRVAIDPYVKMIDRNPGDNLLFL